MEVILKSNVEKLGYKDDLVTVRPGYGRNYLIPQGLAILATPSAKKVREETIRQRAFREEKIRDEATKQAAQLAELKVKVGAKVGEQGKIFGSVNALQLADALKRLGHEVDRKNITIKEEPIRSVGTYEAEVRLHRDLTATVSFEVVEE